MDLTPKFTLLQSKYITVTLTAQPSRTQHSNEDRLRYEPPRPDRCIRNVRLPEQYEKNRENEETQSDPDSELAFRTKTS